MKRIAILVACLLLPACAGDTAGTDSPVDSSSTSTTTTNPTSTTTSTTIPTTTTTTLGPEEIAAAEYEADVQAIKRLWRSYSDSWFGGLDAGYAFLEEHNHPAEGCTAEEFETSWQAVDGYQMEVVIDTASIERDDGWAIPGGEGRGTIPDGRIYIMTASISDAAPGYETTERTTEVHAVITPEGEAKFFFTCPPP